MAIYESAVVPQHLLGWLMLLFPRRRPTTFVVVAAAVLYCARSAAARELQCRRRRNNTNADVLSSSTSRALLHVCRRIVHRFLAVSRTTATEQQKTTLTEHCGTCHCGQARFTLWAPSPSKLLPDRTTHELLQLTADCRLRWDETSSTDSIQTFPLPGGERCRTFCRHCGTHLLLVTTANQEQPVAVYTDCLEDPYRREPSSQPSCVSVASTTEQQHYHHPAAVSVGTNETPLDAPTPTTATSSSSTTTWSLHSPSKRGGSLAGSTAMDTWMLESDAVLENDDEEDDDDEQIRLLELQAKAYRLKQKLAAVSPRPARTDGAATPKNDHHRIPRQPLVTDWVEEDEIAAAASPLPQEDKLRKFLAKHVA